jgi:hypothetical protein
MTRRNFFDVLAVAVLFVSCQGCPPTNNPINRSEPTPTPVPTDTNLCDAAESNLVKLGCDEGRPTKGGMRFGDVCRELQNAGIGINPSCLASITTCEQIDDCTRSF